MCIRDSGNAVYEAKTPVMDSLMAEYPFVKGNASGLAVGLPDGQMGNSEVGHMNMGAGRIVYQELTRITKEINDGDFFKNEALLAAMKNAKDNDSAIHFMGLLSDGGVHSHNTHLYGLLEMAKREGLKKVYVHCFLDGRDTPPASGKGYIEELQAKMNEIGVGEIGVVSGRYYAMDRDNPVCYTHLPYNINSLIGKIKHVKDHFVKNYRISVIQIPLIWIKGKMCIRDRKKALLRKRWHSRMCL